MVEAKQLPLAQNDFSLKGGGGIVVVAHRTGRIVRIDSTPENRPHWDTSATSNLSDAKLPSRILRLKIVPSGGKKTGKLNMRRNRNAVQSFEI